MGDHDDQDEDTDTKLAMLASLLEPASFRTEDLLESLQDSEGDVAKAAEGLLLPRVRSAGKRKSGTSLQGWLGKKRAPDNAGSTSLRPPLHANSKSVKSESSRCSDPVDTQTQHETRLEDGYTKSERPPVDLLSVLKQPATSDKSKNPPRPALHLSNQSAIDSHKLPLTLLQSPLSASFASALYLTMMEESETWERNRFYLAGKWVQSPHTVCHYSRDPPSAEEQGIELLQGKEEGKKATYMWSGQEIAPSRVHASIILGRTQSSGLMSGGRRTDIHSYTQPYCAKQHWRLNQW